MAETIEQMVVRLARDAGFTQVQRASQYNRERVGRLINIVRLEQAKRDAAACNAIHDKHWAAYKRGTGQERADPYYDGKADGACECAAEIIKEAEGMK